MPKFVSVYANGKKGDPVVTVTEAFAAAIGAEVLTDEFALDPRTGRPLPPREAGDYTVEQADEKPTSGTNNPTGNPSGGSASNKTEEAPK